MKNQKQFRMETLKNAGVDVTKFFNIEVTENIPAGSTIQIAITQPAGKNADNSAMITDQYATEEAEEYVKAIADSEVAKRIWEDGYVYNTKIHRRWITAQTFRMLNWSSNCGAGWDACLKAAFPYDYQFKMMANELNVLAHLEKTDMKTFQERAHFFTKDVVIVVVEDYFKKLMKYIQTQRTLRPRHCRREEYVKLARYGNVYVNELQEKVFDKIEDRIISMQLATNYKQLSQEFNLFMSKEYNKLPYETAKSARWKDTFKGIGAYYTLKNMVMFHDITIPHGGKATRSSSMKYLTNLLEEYKGEYWRFHVLLKKVIADNNFDLKESIEKHNK